MLASAYVFQLGLPRCKPNWKEEAVESGVLATCVADAVMESTRVDLALRATLMSDTVIGELPAPATSMATGFKKLFGCRQQ